MHSERVYRFLSTDRTLGGLGDAAYIAQQAGYKASPEQMGVINAARLAAKTGQAIKSGTPEQKAAALEAAKMGVISMLPGGVYAVAFYAAFNAIAGVFGVSSSSIKATPHLIAVKMWNSGSGGGILNAWDQAVHVLEATWNAFRAGKGLSAAPVAIQAGFLVPLDPADRLTGVAPSSTLLINPNPNKGIGPEVMIQGAEQCFLYWLNAYAKGWGTQLIVLNGNRAQNTDRPGAIDEAVGFAGIGTDGAATNYSYSAGRGPFGLDFYYTWPDDCVNKCQTYLVDCVRALWVYRLEALNKAMPEVVGAAVAQCMMEAYSKQQITDAIMTKAKADGAKATAALNAAKSASAKAQIAASIKIYSAIEQEKLAKKFAIAAAALGGLAIVYKYTKKR